MPSPFVLGPGSTDQLRDLIFDTHNTTEMTPAMEMIAIKCQCSKGFPPLGVGFSEAFPPWPEILGRIPPWPVGSSQKDSSRWVMDFGRTFSKGFHRA